MKAGGERDNGGSDGITNAMDMGVSKLQELVMDMEAWRAAIHWVAKNIITESVTRGANN